MVDSTILTKELISQHPLRIKNLSPLTLGASIRADTGSAYQEITNRDGRFFAKATFAGSLSVRLNGR